MLKSGVSSKDISALHDQIYLNICSSINYQTITCPHCGRENRDYQDEQQKTRYCIFCRLSLKALEVPKIVVKNCIVCDRDFLSNSYVFCNGKFCPGCGNILIVSEIFPTSIFIKSELFPKNFIPIKDKIRYF